MSRDKALDPNLAQWLTRMNELTAQQKVQGVQLEPATVRDGLATLTQTFVPTGPELARVDVTQLATPERDIPIRIYDPAPGQAKAVCLFFHGGGHVAGDIQVHDPICRRLAEASQQLWVAVDYRLAPESPYPAGLTDCLAACRHIFADLDNRGIAHNGQLYLVGDSAGGALAATISAYARTDDSLPISRQVLIYPSLDYTLSQPSVQHNGQGYFLETENIRWYFDQYFQNNEDRQAASPLYMPCDHTLPATLVITAGFCPLRDEGFVYANQLQKAGVRCEHHDFADMIHTYLNLEQLVSQDCQQTYSLIGDFLNI